MALPPQLAVALLATAVTILPLATAQAGTGGTEFDVFYDTIVDWAQGSLGKALALAMFLVGIGMGVVRGSVVAAVPAVAGALGLFVAPTIIDAIVTATLTDAALTAVAPVASPAMPIASTRGTPRSAACSTSVTRPNTSSTPR